MVVGGLWCGYILQDQLFNYESVWWLKLPQTGSWNTRQGKNSDISFRCLLIRKEEDWSWVKMKMNETWFCWTWFKRHTLLLLCFLISNRCGVISLFKINAGQIFFTDTATQRESGWAQTSFFSCCCRDCFLYLLLWRSVAWPHEGAAGFLLICIQLELHHKSLRSSRTSTRSSFRWRKLRSAIRVQVLHHCKSCCHPLFSKCEGAALHSSSTSAKVPSETKQKIISALSLFHREELVGSLEPDAFLGCYILPVSSSLSVPTQKKNNICWVNTRKLCKRFHLNEICLYSNEHLCREIWKQIFIIT